MPFALVAESANRLLVHAANARARREGVHDGMALADARAICPQLLTRPAAPLADAKLIETLARLMERASPMVAIDGGDGIFLDVTGVAHLYGGETAMLGTLAGWIERLGFTVRLALADAPGAAWALAHYGGACTLVEPGANAVAIAPLPVAALRIVEEAAELSQRLGLTTIGALYPLPRRTLAARFGLSAVTRLEQALGEQDEPLPYRRFEAPLRETLAFAEPIARTEDVEGAFAIAIERLCARFERDGKGVRLARLAFDRVDNTRQTFAIATARPAVRRGCSCVSYATGSTGSMRASASSVSRWKPNAASRFPPSRGKRSARKTWTMASWSPASWSTGWSTASAMGACSALRMPRAICRSGLMRFFPRLHRRRQARGSRRPLRALRAFCRAPSP